MNPHHQSIAGEGKHALPGGAHSRPGLYLLLLALAWAAIYLPGLFRPPLLDDADSVHAEAARQILVRGDWVTLHIDGIRYLEKAPLMYWAIASTFRVFGVHDWSARLPLALGMLALFLATWSLGRRVYGERGGFYAGLVLATAVGPYLFTRFLIPDMLVALWLTLGFDFFLQTLEQEKPSRAACWGFGAAAALGVLTKGLIGIVFPVAAAGLFLILTGKVGHLRKMRVLSSTVVLLVLAAPWHILAGLRNPAQGDVRGFFWFYFVNEHFLRYLNRRVPRDYGTVPLWLFWALLLVWLLPWSAFLAQAITQVPRKLRGLGPRPRANLLFAAWAAVILVFFSFSTRQEYYAIPALPALALLIGGWLEREAAEPEQQRSGRRSAAGLLVVGGAVFAAAVLLLAGSTAPPPGADIADLLKKNPEEYVLSFGHILDLTPQAFGAFRVPLAGLGLAFLLGTALNFQLRRRGRLLAANLALAGMMVAVLTCVHAGLVIFSPALTSKSLADAITRQYQPGQIVLINGDYEDGSTLNYYTHIPVRILNHREANLWYGSYFPDAPHVFEDDASFERLWAGPARIYLWVEEDDLPALLRDPRVPRYAVARSGGKAILSNQP